jgi:hypothetical protein
LIRSDTALNSRFETETELEVLSLLGDLLGVQCRDPRFFRLADVVLIDNCLLLGDLLGVQCRDPRFFRLADVVLMLS